jgi:uncharacterized protein (DUF885 family)
MRMRATSFASGLAFLILLAASASATAAPSAELAAILADYDRYQTIVDPVSAGQRGDLTALARWPDDRPAAIAERQAALTALARRLAALPRDLAGEDRLNRELLADRIDIDLEGFAFDEERIPFNTGEGFFVMPDFAAEATALRSEEQALAWIKKLEALPAYYDTQIANMRRGLATGFTRPRLVAETVATTLKRRAAAPPEASMLLQPLAALPASLNAGTRAALNARALEVVRSRIKPAEAALANFIATEYLPRTSAGIGIGSVKDGKRYYAYLIHRHASTHMSAERIHALGLAEIARIEAEMDAAIEAAGFRGSRTEFLAFLRAAPQFRPASVDDYLEKTRDVAKRADALLPQYFGTLPRLTYGVRLVSPALKGSSSGYDPGSPEQGLSGSVIVNVDADSLAQATLFGMPAWFLHEGVPGHHLQIALAQERSDLPAFRRNSDINAFVEGWALYSEHLGVEMGMYRTPYENFGRLSLEIWRACRLVIDTGMHVMGWTRDQALACLRDKSALSERSINYEVDRYIGWPAQALGYKVGEIRIREMRARAERLLGSKFDLRAFHDAVLVGGPMPLDILDREIDGWIERHR